MRHYVGFWQIGSHMVLVLMPNAVAQNLLGLPAVQRL